MARSSLFLQSSSLLLLLLLFFPFALTTCYLTPCSYHSSSIDLRACGVPFLVPSSLSTVTVELVPPFIFVQALSHFFLPVGRVRASRTSSLATFRSLIFVKNERSAALSFVPALSGRSSDQERQSRRRERRAHTRIFEIV